MIFWSLPVLGPIFGGLWLFVSALVHLGLLVIMIIAMVKAFTGVRWDIPFVGPIARKQMGETFRRTAFAQGPASGDSVCPL